MDAEQPDTEPTPTDAITERLDPDGLKDAHGRTGRLLKAAGLPFEDEEFEEADDDESSESSGESADESSESDDDE